MEVWWCSDYGNMMVSWKQNDDICAVLLCIWVDGGCIVLRRWRALGDWVQVLFMVTSACRTLPGTARLSLEQTIVPSLTNDTKLLYGSDEYWSSILWVVDMYWCVLQIVWWRYRTIPTGSDMICIICQINVGDDSWWYMTWLVTMPTCCDCDLEVVALWWCDALELSGMMQLMWHDGDVMLILIWCRTVHSNCGMMMKYSIDVDMW
jgi:hypothetical protein